MYVIQFKLFATRLVVDTIGGDYVPKGSPILIIFTLSHEHTKFSILKEFRKHLDINGIEWIKPHENLTEEWIIDLELLRTSFDFLKSEDYLFEKILLEPVFEKKEEIDYLTDKPVIKETSLKFKIIPNELIIFKQNRKEDYLSDLREPLTKFYKDHRQNNKCAFLMMKYEDSPIQSKIVQELRNLFKKHDLELLRADDKYYSDELLTNIRTYMHGCGFGVAIFDRINSEEFNPNVSLEIGYMMALKKPILFLKDITLKSLQTDLVGKLYEEFDFQNSKRSFDKSVSKWLKQHDLLT
jgi:hypothetical protein